jgi:hypothetical protein
MWAREVGVCVVGIVMMTGCGQSNNSLDEAAGSSSDAAGTGGSSSGGSPSGGSPSGGSSPAGTSSGGKSTAGANSGGNPNGGSPAGGAPNAPTTLPDIDCSAGEIVYEGKVGGASVMERFKPTGPAAGGVSVTAYAGGGSVIYFDEETTQEGDISGGILMFPEGSAHAGKIWCIDPGSLIGKGSIRKGALIGHLLGTCPGTPVAGTLQACFDSGQNYCDASAPEKHALGGELAGKAVDSPAVGLTSLSTRAWTQTTEQFDFALFAQTAPTTSTAAKLTGFLVATNENHDFGDVHCVDDGGWKLYSSDELVSDVDQATLSQLSSLGSCKDAGPIETLNVCFGR